MKRTGLMLTGLLALSCIGNAQAQLYKWVSPDGKINYSDLPPPKTARQLEKSPLKSSADSATAALPYVLAEASKNHPVTLFTGAQCIPCDQARDFLKNRGIPFAEKTVTNNEDIASLQRTSGESQLPVLLIGSNKQLGFESAAWNMALSAASYPQDNQLPRDYRFAPAEPAAPKTVAKPEKLDKPANATDRRQPPAAATQRLPASGNAPPDFRF